MRRGFTLIELLAVIVILAIIALIAVPIVINIINDAKIESQKRSIDLYAKILEKAASNYLMKNPNDTEITIKKLEDAKLINYNGEKTICKKNQISKKGKIYLSDCTVGGVKVNYEYGKFELPSPDLSEGLTPVVYDGNNWRVVNKNDPNWYDYDNQKWANAVVLGTDVTKKVGDIVAVDGTEAKMMLVWIPRYEYKIEGQYGKHPDGTDGTSELPGEIRVNFIEKSTLTPSEGYIIHPAFTFGEQELNGIWVGKFELSSININTNNNNNLSCNDQQCENAINLRTLPGKPTTRNNNVSNFFYAIKNIENVDLFRLNTMDTHMIKNSEWGAVAYLSHSKYGKYGNKDYVGAQKEIYINNSSNEYTGRSGGNTSGNTPVNEAYPENTSTNQTSAYGYYTYDGYLMSYNRNYATTTRELNKGTGASTTGNIYGVYDMSGGAWEFVMGVSGDSNGIYTGFNEMNNSGFNGKYGEGGKKTDGSKIPDSKYYDVYTTDNIKTACNNGICYGHALSETQNWYENYSRITNFYSYIWLVRSANNYWSVSGIFYSDAWHGDRDDATTRIVFTKK